MGHRNTYVSQIAKSYHKGGGNLADTFERNGNIFRRLEIYVGVPLITEAMDL